MTMSCEARVLTIAPVMFRSGLPRDRRLFIPNVHQSRRDNQLLFVLRLISHLAMTSLVFLALITLVWVVSWTLSSMQSVHPFPDETFRLLNGLKIVLIYADMLTSGVVLFLGIWNYILKIIRGES